MEVDEEPTHGDEDHASAPAIERSSNRKDVVEEIRRRFEAQGRTFLTHLSSSFRARIDHYVLFPFSLRSLWFITHMCILDLIELDIYVWVHSHNYATGIINIYRYRVET